ncbi:MAG: trimeric intracellular cation channel family protein [Fibrobacter sp.]|jgi:uncharacterized membrane protein YeiH|nr:trimeric intracellular cation channel family protein [Fibrobacter sp.]
MLIVLDILGTLAFAITGASKAIQYKLDWLGLLVLTVITGTGGGILRDVFLGMTPPLAFQKPIYVIVCFFGAILTLVAKEKIHAHWNYVLVVDALGLGFFTAVSANRACLIEGADINILVIIFSAVITAVGGGVIRDLIVREIPFILKQDFYASAAILGALVYIALRFAGIGSPTFQLFATTIFTFLVRLFAMKWRFHLPNT